MAKSKGNIIILKDLIKKGTNPLAYRYLCLTAHYKSKLNFSWKALKAAQNALENLYERIQGIKISNVKPMKSRVALEYQKKFSNLINDDLDTPKAMALLWEVVKSPYLKNQEKYNLILNFDKVLGLNLGQIRKSIIPKEIRDLANQREKYRKEKEWKKADEIRKEIEEFGYRIEDTEKGSKIKEIN